MLKHVQNIIKNDANFIKASPANKAAFFDKMAKRFQQEFLDKALKDTVRYGSEYHDIASKGRNGTFLLRALDATRQVINQLIDFAHGFRNGEITSVDVVDSFKKTTIDKIAKVLKDIDTSIKSNWAKSLLQKGNQKVQGKNPLADKKKPVKRQKKPKPEQFSLDVEKKARDILVFALQKANAAKAENPNHIFSPSEFQVMVFTIAGAKAQTNINNPSGVSVAKCLATAAEKQSVRKEFEFGRSLVPKLQGRLGKSIAAPSFKDIFSSMPAAYISAATNPKNYWEFIKIVGAIAVGIVAGSVNIKLSPSY
jgi:hypothetical protein